MWKMFGSHDPRQLSLWRKLSTCSHNQNKHFFKDIKEKTSTLKMLQMDNVVAGKKKSFS